MPESAKVAARTTCRICGFKELTPILSLGELHISDFLGEQDKPGDKVPLDLVLCNERDGGCGLLQLKHTVSHEDLYRNYWYRSGMNKSMTAELQGIAGKVEEIVQLEAGDRVIDIGANDGTLLRAYRNPKIKRIGFEPARNLAEYNSVGTDRVFNDFFSLAVWAKNFGAAKAKAVTAIAMFYDLEDPNAFVEDVAKVLDPESGVFIIQMSYLPLMLSQNAFDNVVHEHVEYYSLLSLENLLRRHGLKVFDAELNDVNGGSFRTYIRHEGKGSKLRIPAAAARRVEKLRADEDALGLGDRVVYEDFVKRVHSIRDRLGAFIRQEAGKGKKIYVYGASTKGNTLLQYFDLNADLIPAAAERNPAKWGKKTVGTRIPIISEEQARADKPDYFLVLPWHFMDEFIDREAEFLIGGVKFIVPLPEFKIIGSSD